MLLRALTPYSTLVAPLYIRKGIPRAMQTLMPMKSRPKRLCIARYFERNAGDT